MDVKKILSRNVTCLVGDRNGGKSMLLYTLIEELAKTKTDVWVYGMDEYITRRLSAHSFYSLKELENLRNCFVIVDEFISLFDLDDRKKKKSIESSLRTISHNNVKMVLAGLPQNFNRFISSQDCTFIYKKLQINNCIQGSTAKENIKDYQGVEKGSVMLSIDVGDYLLFEGNHWYKGHVAYNSKWDTKKHNIDLFEKKKVTK
jgi:hypothetical protein